MGPAPQRVILVHYHEIGLKGRNQHIFRRQLRDNIRVKLHSVGLDWPVRSAPGYVLVPLTGSDPAEHDRGLNALRQVFGIAWLASCLRLPHQGFRDGFAGADWAILKAHLLGLAAERYTPGNSFCVRVKRSDKSIPFASTEAEAALGGYVKDDTAWERVDLKTPDLTFQVEMHQADWYLFADKLKGPGGLPVGTAGRVLTLLSGGIDSPVAACLMAKRGCQVDFLHFTASSMQPEEARQYKVWRLAQRLSQFTLGSRLFLVPYTYFDLALLRQQVRYDLVLFRRFMARVAGQLAARLKAEALVTGDNLAQVASQTLSNLASTSRVVELPYLRPLIGFDKEEIIELARRFQTYDLSIEPYKDCCALISSEPKTSSQHHRLLALEERIFPDYQQLIDQTLADAVCLEAVPGVDSTGMSGSVSPMPPPA